MGKPRKIGMKTTFTPNSKQDMRHRKKTYQRPREIAQRKPVAGQLVKEKEVLL